MLSKNTLIIVPTLFNYQSVLSDPVTQIHHSFPQGGIELLSSFIDDTASYNAILNHGCWCAKLLDHDSDTLGGNTPVDELDKICKQWFTMRRCNDQHGGGSCFDEGANGLSGPSEFYTIKKSSCKGNNDECQMDSCTIDMHFSQLIADFVATTSGWNAVTPNDCPNPPNAVAPLTRFCHGEAPFKYLAVEPIETAQQTCENAMFDVTILVDGSDSVDQGQWDKAIDFVKGLTNNFDIGPEKTRVTLAQFSYNMKYYARFAPWPAMVEKNVNLMYDDQYKASTMTNVALNGVMNNMRVHGRPDVPQILVLLTDGASSRKLFYPNEFDANKYNTAEKLHELGINSFVVAIGDEIDDSENREIASDPDSSYLHTLDSFDALETIGLQISKMACGLSRSGERLLPPTFVAEGVEAVMHIEEEFTSDLGIYEDLSED